MPEVKVVPFRTPQKPADQTLIAALQQLTEVAQTGKVERMVLVWTDDENVAHSTAYRANDLTLIGALSVTVSGLQAKWDT